MSLLHRIATSLLQRIATSLLQRIAKSLLHIIATSLHQRIATSLLQRIAKYLLHRIAKSLLHRIATSLLQRVAKSLLQRIAKSLLHRIAKSLLHRIVSARHMLLLISIWSSVLCLSMIVVFSCWWTWFVVSLFFSWSPFRISHHQLLSCLDIIMMLLVQYVVHLWQYLIWMDFVSCWQPLP